MDNRIVWREGLFIRPQHFQQNDRYYAYELMKRTSSSGSNKWGFFDLEIDQDLLGSGKVVIKRASGILKDGTLFNIDSKDNILALDINSDDYNKNIYLALPILISNSDDVHFEDQENILTRFRSKSVSEISNSNSGENSVSDILIAKHNFKLLREEEANESYIKIKVSAIVSLSSSGLVTLDNSYIPTFLHLNKMSDLGSKIDELMSMLSYRSEKLAEKISNSSLQASELGNFLMLQLINKSESHLHFLMSQDKIHPQDLFLALSSLASELAIFMKKEKKLRSPFLYVHEELGLSFGSIIEELKYMLSMVLEQNSITLNIEKRKYGISVAQIKDKEILYNSSFILTVTADEKEEEIKKSLMTNLKMGSIENIRNLVNYHLKGFKIKALPTPPREIPYRVNHLYFEIELETKDKEELAKSGGFAFHMSSELSNLEYALWAIRSN
ncbi:MAG: type VI secretion system baseplate subunit TssK [Campylobacterales bacterium]|nr:type VI secretion system baseplate subunit TssK [Campylobacterales bacterium]NQY53083.1 type VI secretion system baseplate subunit TssK [Campylobacteraceae bacterium]